jgi:hypothetical protein
VKCAVSNTNGERWRLLGAALIAGAGLLFAVRALAPASTAEKVDDERVRAAREARAPVESRYVTPTTETAGRVARDAAAQLEKSLRVSGAPVLEADQRADLLRTFELRLRAWLAADHEAHMRDLRERATVIPRSTLDGGREHWLRTFGRIRLFPVQPQRVSVRELDPRVTEDVTRDSLGVGQQRSCNTAIPVDASGDPMREYVVPVERLIEVRIPAILPDDDGVRAPVELALRYTWLPDSGSWRLIQTCVFFPGDGQYKLAAPPAL